MFQYNNKNNNIYFDKRLFVPLDFIYSPFLFIFTIFTNESKYESKLRKILNYNQNNDYDDLHKYYEFCDLVRRYNKLMTKEMQKCTGYIFLNILKNKKFENYSKLIKSDFINDNFIDFSKVIFYNNNLTSVTNYIDNFIKDKNVYWEELLENKKYYLENLSLMEIFEDLNNFTEEKIESKLIYFYYSSLIYEDYRHYLEVNINRELFYCNFLRHYKNNGGDITLNVSITGALSYLIKKGIKNTKIGNKFYNYRHKFLSFYLFSGSFYLTRLFLVYNQNNNITSKVGVDKY